MIENTPQNMEKSYVYFVVAVEVPRFKIGVAMDVEQRLSDLSVGSPCELYLHGFIICSGKSDAFKLESYLHKLFKSYHSHREWFEWNDDSKSLLRKVMAGDGFLPEEYTGPDVQIYLEQHKNLISLNTRRALRRKGGVYPL